MKIKQKILILLCAGLLLLAACGPKDPAPSSTPEQTDTAATADSNPTESATPEPTPEPVIEQENPYEWIDANDAGREKGWNNHAMVGVDEFGRVLTAADSERDNRAVGIFYAPDFGQLNFTDVNPGIFDVEKIIAQYGMEKVFLEESEISPNWSTHWWGEPLYGYYSSSDPYIVRKHLELMTMAGIDYIVLDVTNGWIFTEVSRKMQKEIVELRADGWDAPQIVYYVHSLNNKTVREIYRDVYQNKRYEEAWYKRDGKPVIIAYTETEKDIAEAKTRGVTDFSDGTYEPLSQEILDFFYFVEPRWPDDIYLSWSDPRKDADKKTGFNWIEWTYPLPQRTTSLGTFVNVAVASHPSIPFSFSVTRGAANWGRGYNPGLRKGTEEGNYTGTYFQICWDRALKVDPENVFLVYWNAWTALKQPYDGEYMLCDTATFEYSLSIEPAKEFYHDSYYMQMMSNMRKYKYTAENLPVYKQRTVDINGSYAQWYYDEAIYRQVGTDTYKRSSKSCDAAATYTYQVSKPANNVQEVRVAHDTENLYFMIRCGEPITDRGDAANWMNLLIGTGTPELKGWNGYEYLLNRSTGDGKSTIERLNADFTGETVGEATLVVRDNFMFLSVPRASIGLSAENTFYFKVADSVEKPSDIMEYYVSGSVLPIGRMAYTYTGA